MNNTLLALVFVLSACCLLEFAILLKDGGRFRRILSRAKASVKDRGLFPTLFKAPKFLLKKLLKKNQSGQPEAQSQAENSLQNTIANDDGKIRVAFLFEGGYGDFLLCANFFDYFRKKFGADNISFDLYGTGGLKDIFNYPIPNVAIFDRKDCPFDNMARYDVFFKIAKRNQLMHADKERLLKYAPDLREYILMCEKYAQENKPLFEMNPRLDGLNSSVSIAQGKKRIQEADIYGFLGVTEDFKYEFLIKEDEDAYLKSLGLVSKKFILVHRGWDAAYNKGEHVKAWSIKSCGDIIERLKKEFPNYKIVLFGVDRQQAPSAKGADIDLIGKTTLNQAKVLLKHAAVLIDNEGGMVHLRHALKGGPSVILFGPTAKELFGYSENKNITSNVCAHWCEWLSEDWQYKCAKTGKNGHPCMDAINSSDIISAVKSILK